MAASDEHQAITKAFSGLGVDEKTIVSILGKWHPEQRQTFRKGTRDFFIEDERKFERWNDRLILLLRQEFLRFKEAIVLWTMHPWERDARLFKESLSKGPQFNVIVEIACTRSSEELLGARKAYHSLYDHSIEEDVASRVNGPERKLLVGLVSSYRYEGPKVNGDSAKTEAKAIFNTIKGNKDILEDEGLLRVLSTRSKSHLNQLYKFYKEISGTNLDEDLKSNSLLKETVECLCKPEAYFCKILDSSFQHNAEEVSKDAVTRVVVTQANIHMKEIKEEFNARYGVSLAKKVEEVANGNYRDFLLTLIARGD